MSHSPGVDCRHCPLRALPLFSDAGPQDRELIATLRRPQLRQPAGATLIAEGREPAAVFTLFSGWAFRYKTLGDGRRQILNFLLPGDFVGLQQRMDDQATHGVEALTDVWLCPFGRNMIWQLHRESPRLGYDVTWLCATEEGLVDDHLLSIGRRSAEERLAALLLWLYQRASALRPGLHGSAVPFPLTQQHLADALGLSLPHTHRSLRRLQRRGWHRIEKRQLRILDAEALARLAELEHDGRPARRPLL